MLVSETKIFTPGRLKIKVTSLDGVDLSLEVSPEMTIEQVAVLACSHLEETTEAVKVARYRRLVHVNTQRDLSKDKTLEQLDIKENDEFILIKKRAATKKTEKTKNKGKETISDEAIKEATKDVKPVNTYRPTPAPISGQDFQTDLKRILITLIDAAERILCLNPEAARVFKEGEEILHEQKFGKVNIDQTALKKLQDMGFSERRASKALIISKMNTVAAMEWLLEHESDPDIDEAIPGMEDYEEPPLEGATGETSPLENPLEIAKDLEDSHINDAKRIIRILESFKALHKKEFKPNPVALKNLIEMGFDEKAAVNALKIARNKQEDACELLLSGNAKTEDVAVSDKGFDPDGPICKAILANPQVQLGLANPRSLLAFLHILQNPMSCHQWLNDPDTGPVLHQISRIYHAEKHATQSTPKRKTAVPLMDQPGEAMTSPEHSMSSSDSSRSTEGSSISSDSSASTERTSLSRLVGESRISPKPSRSNEASGSSPGHSRSTKDSKLSLKNTTEPDEGSQASSD